MSFIFCRKCPLASATCAASCHVETLGRSLWFGVPLYQRLQWFLPATVLQLHEVMPDSPPLSSNYFFLADQHNLHILRTYYFMYAITSQTNACQVVSMHPTAGFPHLLSTTLLEVLVPFIRRVSAQKSVAMMLNLHPNSSELGGLRFLNDG